MHHKLPVLPVILGPTASGKTALALALAQRFPVEIISLDSALVYRDMDIGTAKPTAAERLAVPHHLLDIIAPTEHYSAADFVRDCIACVADIRGRGKLPLLVGGTMMYYQALIQGLNDLPEADPAVRAQLQQQKQQYGLSELYCQLQAIDPETAARLKPNDSQRIERALEVYQITGQPMSRLLEQSPAPSLPFVPSALALIPAERGWLHANIERRLTQMFAAGFLDEVRQLRQTYPTLSAEHPAMRCVGYRQAWAYLDGEIDADTLFQQALVATRQLAKRQLTWLRRLPVAAVADPFADDVMAKALAWWMNLQQEM